MMGCRYKMSENVVWRKNPRIGAWKKQYIFPLVFKWGTYLPLKLYFWSGHTIFEMCNRHTQDVKLAVNYMSFQSKIFVRAGNTKKGIWMAFILNNVTRRNSQGREWILKEEDAWPRCGSPLLKDEICLF